MFAASRAASTQRASRGESVTTKSPKSLKSRLDERRSRPAWQLWVLKYPVWAKRDGYIPVYTVGMVNTRYIPVFLEYSDPSTVSRLRVEPPRAAPAVPPRHALGDAARMLRWAYYSLLARATAGWGAVVGLGVRGRRARARRGTAQARRGRARQPRRTRLRVAQNQNTRYGKTGPGIYRYIPVFYHTGIYPPRYPSRHSARRPRVRVGGRESARRTSGTRSRRRT